MLKEDARLFDFKKVKNRPFGRLRYLLLLRKASKYFLRIITPASKSSILFYSTPNQMPFRFDDVTN